MREPSNALDQSHAMPETSTKEIGQQSRKKEDEGYLIEGGKGWLCT